MFNMWDILNSSEDITQSLCDLKTLRDYLKEHIKNTNYTAESTKKIIQTLHDKINLSKVDCYTTLRNLNKMKPLIRYVNMLINQYKRLIKRFNQRELNLMVISCSGIYRTCQRKSNQTPLDMNTLLTEIENNLAKSVNKNSDYIRLYWLIQSTLYRYVNMKIIRNSKEDLEIIKLWEDIRNHLLSEENYKNKLYTEKVECLKTLEDNLKMLKARGIHKRDTGKTQLDKIEWMIECCNNFVQFKVYADSGNLTFDQRAEMIALGHVIC